MIVEFHPDCKEEHSKWSYSWKLYQLLVDWHDVNCQGMTAQQAVNWRKANFRPKQKAVMAEIRKAEDSARLGTHWNPRVPDHAQNGEITYPPGLDQENEGSRGIFLMGLQHKVVEADFDLSGEDLQVVQSALGQAKKDAITGSHWSPSLGDITDA